MGLISYLFGKKENKSLALEDRFNAWEAKLNKIDELEKRIAMLSNPVLPLEKKENRASLIKAVLVNNTLTVLLNSGEVLVNTEANKGLYSSVLEAMTEDQVRNIMFPGLLEEKLKIEIKKVNSKGDDRKSKDEKISEYSKYLVESGDFEIKDNRVYMVGIDISLPRLILDHLTILVDKILGPAMNDSLSMEKMSTEYEALKNFWRWCALCPNPQSREDLFSFLEKHDLKLNKNGMFFAYRNVEEARNVVADTNMISQISNLYLQIKTKWKKNPANFTVFVDDNKIYRAVETKKLAGKTTDIPVGILSDLYQGLSTNEEPSFTDQYTGKMDIRIGKEVSMDRKLCDSDNNQSCSKGLHVGNKTFGFSSYGSTHILVLINPMNAVSVPLGETNKMRVCAYLPVAVLTDEKSGTFLENAEVIDLADDYFIEQTRNIRNSLLEKAPTEEKRTGFELNILNVFTKFAEDATKIEDERNKAKKAIAKRTVQQS